MTQDEIIEMAMEAEFVLHGKPSEEESELFVCIDKDIVRFYNLVAAKAFQNGYEKGVAAFTEAVNLEREACAKLCDDIEAQCIAEDSDDPPLHHIATAIRARGEQA